MHSILYALSQFDAEAIVVGPPDMSLLPEFKAELDALNVVYREAGDVRDVIGEADVIYMEPVVQADYTASRSRCHSSASSSAWRSRPKCRRTCAAATSSASRSGRRRRSTPSSTSPSS